jgi:DNA alkylation repair enzyme
MSDVLPVQGPSRAGACSAARVVDRSDLELIEAVRAALRGAAQPELARPLQAHLKSATRFLGVRVPVMRTLTRSQAKLRPFTASADLIDTVLRLWRGGGLPSRSGTPPSGCSTRPRRLRDLAVLPALRELIVTGVVGLSARARPPGR